MADVSGSLSAIDQARALLALLTDDERAALIQSEQPRRALQAINETFGSAPFPQRWPAWLDELQSPTFTKAQAVARQAATEWDPSLGDPVEIARLADGLVSVRDNPPASDRLIEGIPHLVAWLQRDPKFRRPVGYSVYEAGLERLMLSGRTAAPMLDSAGVLARAMLAIGPAPTAYGRLLSDLLEFSGQAAGVRTAYWLMELAEETVAANTPDQTAREQFWQSVVSRLVPIGPQLSPLQRASLARLGGMLGREGALPDALTIGPGMPSDPTLASRLAGKMVAIYTLTESAGAQAAEAILAIAPEVDIRVNSDHGGSRPLRALAENAHLSSLWLHPQPMPPQISFARSGVPNPSAIRPAAARSVSCARLKTGRFAPIHLRPKPRSKRDRRTCRKRQCGGSRDRFRPDRSSFIGSI